MAHITESLAQQQILDALIDLTQLSVADRAIIIGGGSLDLCVALQRRGFYRVGTTGTCPVARGQHAIGLIMGQHSLQALQTAIESLSHYLGTTSTMAIVIDPASHGLGLKIRPVLERLGFRIEAGVRCQQGFVLAARRQNAGHMAKAA